jgi:hypothetical protein
MSSLCFTKEEDARLARGWPHCVVFVDGHPHDARPLPSATAVVGNIDAKYRTEWPREVAYRFLRAGCITQFRKSNFADSKLTKATREILETPGPMSKDEAKRALADAVVSCEQHYAFKVQDFVYGIEALIGSDDALDALVTGFEASSTSLPASGGTPLHTYFKTYAAGALGMMLLRASPSAKKKLLPRLEAQAERFGAAGKKHRDWGWCGEHFDMSLHGAAGVKRVMTGSVQMDYLVYAHDDPDFVRDSAAALPKSAMSVRLVSIGGLALMKGLLARKFPAPALPSVLRDFGMIRAPEAAELALSLVGKASVKDAPLRWLVTHAELARPVVEEAAKRGAKSAVAKSVLKQLPRS